MDQLEHICIALYHLYMTVQVGPPLCSNPYSVQACRVNCCFADVGGVAVEQPLVHFQALLAGGLVLAAGGEEHRELGVCYPVVE